MGLPYIKTLPRYSSTETDQDIINSWYTTAWDYTIAYLFIDILDRLKYGSLVKGLYSQNSLRNDQYPSTEVKS